MNDTSIQGEVKPFSNRIIWFDGPLVDLLEHAQEKSKDSRIIEIEISSVSDLLNDVMEKMAREVIRDFPQWLPGAEVLTDDDPIGLAAVTALASSFAKETDHFEKFLVKAARAALSRSEFNPLDEFPPDLAFEELSKLLIQGAGCHQLFLVLRCENVDLKDRQFLRDLDWLEERSPIQILVLAKEGTQPPVRTPAERPTFPPESGAPSPISAAEQRLEDVLLSQSWAQGRAWNATWQSSPAANLIRLDLTWESEKCTIELDGPEHCAPEHYKADRIRDRRLQAQGYLVLRFTNDEVLHDTALVTSEIESILTKRRNNEL